MSVEAIVLGIAQDGGLPQAGCDCANCRRAWSDPTRRQLVVCLGLVDHATQQAWLIDATPDFREQLHSLQGTAPTCSLAGILLTHAHMGHYSGLIHLGREAMNTRRLPVHATQRMAAFLQANVPWSRLIAQQNAVIRILTPDTAVQLSPQLQVVPVPVPHRDEFSDAVALVIQGPARRLFYCPDIDSWQHWDRDLLSFLKDIDVALLDATFWSVDELRDRGMGEIPHPLALDTIELVAGTACEVRLIHLNHTNPLLTPGPEREMLAVQGLGIGCFGQRWSLG